MAATYTDPSNSQSDEVRYLVGDTNVADLVVILQDEEIAFEIANGGNTSQIAARCCEAIVAKLSGEADFSTGGTSRQKSQRVAHYRKLAQDLRRRQARYVAPSAGAITLAQKAENEANEDLVQGQFRSNQFRNPNRDMSQQNSGDESE